MKLKLKEQTQRAVPIVAAKKGIKTPPEEIIKTVREKTGKTVDAKAAKKAAEDLEKAGEVTVMTEFVVDSLGEALSVGDIIEVRGNKFTLKESENGVCIATMEGKCLMDVKNSESRKLFENSIKVKTESYEPSSPNEPVLSVGHVDDEAGMLKQTVYDIVKYGADLYKMLERYESLNMHVDFPHWWQSKVVKARDYISMTTHYLEYETNEREIQSQIHNLEV